MITNQQMRKAQLDHEATSYAEFDRQCEEAGMKQAKIDTEADSYMKNDDTVEELISENADVVWSIIKSGNDIQAKLMGSIRHWAECEAERNLEL